MIKYSCKEFLASLKKTPKDVQKARLSILQLFEENQRLQSVDRDKINNVVIWQVK